MPSSFVRTDNDIFTLRGFWNDFLFFHNISPPPSPPLPSFPVPLMHLGECVPPPLSRASLSMSLPVSQRCYFLSACCCSTSCLAAC